MAAGALVSVDGSGCRLTAVAAGALVSVDGGGCRLAAEAVAAGAFVSELVSPPGTSRSAAPAETAVVDLEALLPTPLTLRDVTELLCVLGD